MMSGLEVLFLKPASFYVATVFLILPLRSSAQRITDLRQTGLTASEVALFSGEIKSSVETDNKFVKWAALGQALALAHRYEESNRSFERAYLLKMDERSLRGYRKEECYDEFYQVSMVLYFKALNYLELGDVENARVECNRMDEWMRPRVHDDVVRAMLSQDPLIQTMMGIIYEASEDYSDSWISFTKAKGLLQADYSGLYSKHVPAQLTRDQLEMDSMAEASEHAILPGQNHHYGKLIFLWHNGQGPQKEISGGDFKIKSTDGTFRTNVPDVMPFTDAMGNTLIPYYKFNRPFYSSPQLSSAGRTIPCELLEDINWFSVLELQKRLNTNGIHVWREGINWNTLPSSIYYGVMPLGFGQNNIEFSVRGEGGVTKKESFMIIGDGKTHFHVITTLASIPLVVTGRPIKSEWEIKSPWSVYDEHEPAAFTVRIP